MADLTSVKEITDRLENGVTGLFDSDKYAAYLKTMSRFHRYSTRNTLLIFLQHPDATRVAGYQDWKNKFSRQVKKGEHGIKILAPTPIVVKKDLEKLDPETQRPIIGEDGEPVREEIEVRTARFKVVSVFDISQTIGEPLPELAETLNGDVERYELFMDSIRAVSPLPIVFEDLPPETDGICRFGDRISIRDGMSEIQTVSAVLHELAHSKLHDLEVVSENGETPKDRRTEEVEAEGVAFTVASFFSVETGANSFGYIGEWSRSRELKELNASLDTIRKTASELINGIDEKYRALAKERGIDLSADVPQKAQDAPAPEMTPAEPAALPPDLSANQIYAKYANIVADRAAQYADSSGTLSYTDETAARRACDQIVNRVVNDILLEPGRYEPGGRYSLYSQYMDNPDFKARLEDYAFIKAYLEPKKAMQEAQAAPEQEPEAEPEPIAPAKVRIPDYSAFIFNGQPVTDKNPAVGATVLLPPVFDGGNYNRDGKRIRVTVEEPAGKYLLFSREEHDRKALYFLTASGMIDYTREYFRDEYNEETHKWESHRPTEAELDEMLPQIAARFERDMADPSMWAKYQHAAVLDRLGECDEHNVPVRKLRDEEQKRREAEGEQERQERQLQKQEKFDARVDEIAGAIKSGKSISVGYDEYAFDGKNPVLGLFKLYGVDLPLRTQGWVNTGLAEITDGSYRYYKGKHKGDSTTFGGYLKKLRDAIQLTPIDQIRQREPAAKTEVKDTLENKLYEKFAGLFPDFAGGKYSYMRLESKGFEPLSLEWVFGDRISVMHTYELNGDLCYDPMMEFRFNNIGKTMEASMFQQSIPPLYQYFDDDGIGRSVDGNGNGKAIRGLQAQLNDFADSWLNNIAEQGFMPVKANLVIGGDDEVRVTFDADGNMIMPEPEKGYDLHYGFLGNGITVWNRAEEVNGDYKTVAHIATDRTVAIYDEGMPHEVRQRIDTVANSPETWASGFSPAPENVPPHIDGAPAPASVYETVKRVLPENMTANDARMPDPAVTILQMKEYGYKDRGMIPLTESWALQFYDSNNTVYLLYPDNTEAMALDREEIAKHDGLFGIERDDWERSPEYAAKKAAAANAEGAREADLLYGDNQYNRENKFGIYQVRDDLDPARDFRFVPMRELEALGLPVDRANYELVYTAPLTERIEFLSDRYPALNRIYQDFNENHPADYTARSISVSDVIVLRHNGDISTFYVDSVGFKELDGFLGDENSREAEKREAERTSPAFSQVGKSPENNAQPETGYQESGDIPYIAVPSPKSPEFLKLMADVKEGKSISISELSKAVNAERKPVPKGKPSLLARLDEAKKQAGQNKQTAVATNKKERGYE